MSPMSPMSHVPSLTQSRSAWLLLFFHQPTTLCLNGTLSECKGTHKISPHWHWCQLSQDNLWYKVYGRYTLRSMDGMLCGVAFVGHQAFSLNLSFGTHETNHGLDILIFFILALRTEPQAAQYCHNHSSRDVRREPWGKILRRNQSQIKFIEHSISNQFISIVVYEKISNHIISNEKKQILRRPDRRAARGGGRGHTHTHTRRRTS